MMFHEFMENMEHYKDDSLVLKFHEILDEIKKHVTEPEDIRALLRDMEDVLGEIENMDGFGTEGMRL